MSLGPKLRFFDNKLSDLNGLRLDLSRGKGLASFLTKNKTRNLATINTTFGVASFSIYMVRFPVNLVHLVELLLEENLSFEQHILKRELYYKLFNDCLWGICNFAQFFWLSSKNSVVAGLYGMQLNTIIQILDGIIDIIHFNQKRNEFLTKLNLADGDQREKILHEWRKTQLNFIKSLLTNVLIAVIIGVNAFSIVAVPIAPLMTILMLTRSLISLSINSWSDNQQKAIAQQNHLAPNLLHRMIREQQGARLQEINKLVFTNGFIPLGFIVLFAAPLPCALLICCSMLLSYLLLKKLIDREYSIPQNSLIATDEIETYESKAVDLISHISLDSQVILSEFREESVSINHL